MDNLIEITRLVSRLHDGKVIFKRVSRDTESFYYRMYQGILSGRFTSDQEAAKELYDSHSTDSRYQKLKIRYRKKVLSKLFDLDVETHFHNHYGLSIYQCCLNIFSSQILGMNGLEDASVKVMRYALTMARQHDLTEFELIALKKLRYRAAFDGDRMKFNFYNKRLKEIFLRLGDELESEELTQELIYQNVKSLCPKYKDNHPKEIFDKLKKLNERNNTHTTRLNYYRNAVKYYYSDRKHEEAIKVCNTALQYLSDKRFYQRAKVGEFALYKMQNSLASRNYKMGVQCLRTCLQFFKTGTNNWFNFLETYFILCLHVGKYRQAKTIYDDMLKYPHFIKCSNERKEKWELYRSYLSIVSPGLISPDKINLAKFLNNILFYSNDKAGYNLAATFLEILLRTGRGEYDVLFRKQYAYEKYFRRHISREKNPREYYFSKLLEILIDKEFDHAYVSRLAPRFLSKLNDYQAKSSVHSIEIIPYEVLWSNIMRTVSETRKLYYVA